MTYKSSVYEQNRNDTMSTDILPAAHYHVHTLITLLSLMNLSRTANSTTSTASRP